MNHSRFIKLILVFTLLLMNSCAYMSKTKKPAFEPATNIRLTAIFSDNMVLQQNFECPVWGTANPGGQVTVQIANQKTTAIVAEDGKWNTELAPMKVGGPYELSIIGRDTITFKNVLVGEVWVCSGQSNMEWSVERANNAQAEIEDANYPNIRLFTAKRNVASRPLSDVISDGWKVCSPENIPTFSAVGYFFGRHLHEHLNIPIGLIHSSWGGTPAEAWTSKESLAQLPDFAEAVKQIELSSDSSVKVLEEYKQKLNAWEKAFENWKQVVIQKDAGLAATGKTWNETDYDDSQWGKMEIPGAWETQGLEGYDGIVWFRKAVTTPESWNEQELTLHLGPIDDIDITWFNGVKVGAEQVYNKPRIYKIPDSLVHKNRNVIAVRVFDHGGNGGFWGSSDQCKLYSASGDSISLSGQWLYNVGVDLADIPESAERPKRPQHQPSMLYNAMIDPLIPYRIQGAIWYQGESNASRAYQYRTLFPTMITDWRQNWGQGDFPFIFVQLANFRTIKSQPAEDDWAELREAQLMTLKLSNTGMAVTIDIGEADDIHPRNKQDVGKRLALNARHLAYGEGIPYSGPIYKSKQIEANRIRLSFDHVYDGLEVRGDKLKGFAIAGADKKFYWADAEIDGETVVVSNPKVPNPVAVRYAWASNPICNLHNSAGLPASPFRTDDWPGITQKRSNNQ